MVSESESLLLYYPLLLTVNTIFVQIYVCENSCVAGEPWRLRYGATTQPHRSPATATSRWSPPSKLIHVNVLRHLFQVIQYSNRSTKTPPEKPYSMTRGRIRHSLVIQRTNPTQPGDFPLLSKNYSSDARLRGLDCSMQVLIFMKRCRRRCLVIRIVTHKASCKQLWSLYPSLKLCK